MLTTGKNGTRVVSALHARANFGKLLRRVEDERRSLVIGKAGHSQGDRKSTRLNSSHLGISYAVFCLKKKKNIAGAATIAVLLGQETTLDPQATRRHGAEERRAVCVAPGFSLELSRVVFFFLSVAPPRDSPPSPPPPAPRY